MSNNCFLEWKFVFMSCINLIKHVCHEFRSIKNIFLLRKSKKQRKLIDLERIKRKRANSYILFSSIVDYNTVFSCFYIEKVDNKNFGLSFLRSIFKFFNIESCNLQESYFMFSYSVFLCLFSSGGDTYWLLTNDVIAR